MPRSAIIGDGGVGKTAILNRYMNDDFNPDYNPTIFDDYECAPFEAPSAQLLCRLAW
eukprot:COSAG01_NODE_5483_length_4230_cov_17.465505_9_plen_57_part_00